jgi:lipid-binding SYLF domain-containing protein
MQRLLALCAVFLMFAVASPEARADAKTDQRLADSQKVFESFSNLTEQSIPTWMLERAYGIVVVPRVIKACSPRTSCWCSCRARASKASLEAR